MKLKTFFFVIAVFFCSIVHTAYAQFDILDKVKQKVEQKVDEKTDEAIDDGLNQAEEGIKGNKDKDANTEKNKNKKSKINAEDEEQNDKVQSSSGAKQEEGLKSYSKFDFVPGEQVTFFDDFSQDAVGDFPPNWNTDGTAEVVKIGNMPGQWLKWSAGVSYGPMLQNAFPDNFTLEFDLVLKEIADRDNPYFGLRIYSTDSKEFENGDTPGKAGIGVHYQTNCEIIHWGDGDVKDIGNSAQVLISSLYGNKSHFSIWVQKQRLRIYVNEIKIIDLPRAFYEGFKYNRINFINNPGLNLSNENYGEIYLSNVRIAVGAPDMRSKLMTEGKLVTRGILFDVNSDKIKPESFGTLKEIAQVLKDNAGVKVKIVGHTDSDGADAANLDLSKRRAAAVKNSLSNDFGIDASRMDTDGKGESQPAGPNTSPEGKANNRRVEFIKM